MNTLTFPLSVALETPTRRAVSVDPYASEAQTDALLRSGAAYRRECIQAADMITTDDAAGLAGTTPLLQSLLVARTHALARHCLSAGLHGLVDAARRSGVPLLADEAA